MLLRKSLNLKVANLSVGARHEVDAYLRCVDIQIVIFEEL